MDDPSKFASIADYNILMYAVGLLLFSECVIMFLAKVAFRINRCVTESVSKVRKTLKSV